MRESLQAALGDSLGEEVFDIMFYGSALACEFIISRNIPGKQFASLFRNMKAATAMGAAGQAVNDIFGAIGNCVTGEQNWEFSLSAYFKSAEQAAFNSLAFAALPQPPCGNALGKWLWLQTGQIGVGLLNDAVNTGNVNIDERWAYSAATGGALSLLGSGADSKYVKYVLNVFGHVGAEAAYDYAKLMEGMENMPPEEQEKAMTMFYLDTLRALTSSVVTNATQALFEIEPVDAVRGLLYEEFTDLSIKGVGFGIDVTRRYNSKNHAIGVLGQGFTLSLFSHIAKDGRALLATLPDGSAEAFLHDGAGWASAKGGSRRCEVHDDPFTGETHMAWQGLAYTYNRRGHLSSVEDRNGNSMHYSYIGGTDLVSRIDKSDGQWLEFTYANGRLTAITDRIGRKVEYGHQNEFLAEARAQTARRPLQLLGRRVHRVHRRRQRGEIR
jgi:YD repeat-containing protein